MCLTSADLFCSVRSTNHCRRFSGMSLNCQFLYRFPNHILIEPGSGPNSEVRAPGLTVLSAIWGLQSMLFKRQITERIRGFRIDKNTAEIHTRFELFDSEVEKSPPQRVASDALGYIDIHVVTGSWYEASRQSAGKLMKH